MINFNLKLFVICGLLFVIFAAHAAHAAELYFSARAENIRIDDVFVVEARLSSPDISINVADGSILFDKEKFEVRELSAGGSILSLWAQEPSFSNLAGTISFVGGTPEGFRGDGLILKAILRAKEAGEAKLSYADDFALFLADGKGTRIKPVFSPLSLTIYSRPSNIQPKDEWEEFIAGDTTPPEFTEAIVSQDPRVFDGKYFISFFAADRASGVAYYEVREGEREWTRAVSPYVLQDQTLESAMQIKAVDAAGNEAVITPQVSVPPELPVAKYLVWVFALIVAIAVILALRNKIKNKKQNHGI
ncbi:MAG: hypothetical protein Q8P76_01200 [bacterium]|nr:hypothetical protein [bacterium]